MDDIDRRVLRLLEKNARATNVELARKLGVSEGTVRNRLQKMLSNKTLRFSAELSTKTGFRAIVLLKCDSRSITKKIVGKLLALDEVKRALEVSGEWDVVVEASTGSAEEYNDAVEKIRAVDGVQETQSLIVLKIS